MFVIIFLFCLLGLLLDQSFAQGTINVSDRIVASYNVGLEGCIIELENLTAVTSSEGNFTLAGTAVK